MRRHQASDEKEQIEKTAGCADEADNDRTAIKDYSRSFNIDDSQQQLNIPNWSSNKKQMKESKKSKVDDSIGFENQMGAREISMM